ncbi:methyltransferase family protein [Actinobacillus arthritidis]|uniref:methyltransferase family protein n=1 Tax=Actinobacillus arthritidis TaxID=157339 RepID=UPI002442A75F|nr:isoprenylcysteine carboxylmethyltransferase family protein [Actinobacillus arthritidis]WGE88805.1 isoprenylcysteine carboxylmethyltransferase family protein [Actinobacillus arthritidis]
MELKIPPPLLFAIASLAIYFLPHSSIYFIPKFLSYILLLLAFLIGGMSVYTFWQVKTTLTPLDPKQTSQLVVKGIYRVSRNPMYLSLVLLLSALTIWLPSYWGFLVIIGFILYLNRFQIMPEERALTEKFGQDFVSYQDKVRRWL